MWQLPQSLCCSSVNRDHRLGGHISQYINYGNHEGNEFYYNDTLKLLSVSYFGEHH